MVHWKSHHGKNPKVVMIVIIKLHIRVIFRNIFSKNMKVSSILEMIVIIKLDIRVIFRNIFSLNMLERSWQMVMDCWKMSLHTFLSCSLIFTLTARILYFFMNWYAICVLRFSLNAPNVIKFVFHSPTWLFTWSSCPEIFMITCLLDIHS